MNEGGHQRLSRVYATAQSVVLALFAGADFLDHTHLLFPRSHAVLIIALVACWLGVILILVGVYTLRQVTPIVPEPMPDGRLVTAGVYRVLRHPIYTGVLLAVIGIYLLNPRWIVGLAALLVILYLLLKVRFEEKLLALRYPGYASYKARSFGLIPLWRG